MVGNEKDPPCCLSTASVHTHEDTCTQSCSVRIHDISARVPCGHSRGARASCVRLSPTLYVHVRVYAGSLGCRLAYVLP